MIVESVASSDSVLVSTITLVIVDGVVVSDFVLVSTISLVIVDGVVSDSVVVYCTNSFVVVSFGQTDKLDAGILGMVCAVLEQESVNSDPGAAPGM